MTVNYPKYPHPLALPWPRPGHGGAAPKQDIPRTRLFRLLALGLLCINIPCIARDAHRPRQSECKANLKSLFTALRTFHPGPQGTRGSHPTLLEIGFSPERSNHYAYFLGWGPMEDRSGMEAVSVEGQMGIGVDTFKFPRDRALTPRDLPLDLAGQIGFKGACPDCDFIAACAGDDDNNPKDNPDVWSISSLDREIEGVPVAAGEPYHHVNDQTAH
ncbi:hypothetical protein [Hyalangium rubrum]|uniref:Uncharacterized protein n=1 Tax=Hyalangium rubrum TaxID=3103134 RepID=A0ABU5H447_9BACT|nr:hypothetical protein [Hyalangium sp. s54d21]MDY7228242.1 hypothetical protein [Hyalangium sp. s54d21]